MNIPGYQLGREIAAVEYSSVYSAMELASSKTVTVTVFHQELSSHPEFCSHVKKISTLLLNKSIGNIIPLKQSRWDSEGCYFITNYFSNAQNQKLLPTELSIDEVLNIGQQLANSLSQLHGMSLVHGRISTPNLLFHDRSQITLGQISVQRTLKNDSLITSSLGISLDEASYIAPEFPTGLDARSDFYSLGVVLFELLFKTKPFIAENQQQLQVFKENMQFAVPHGDAENLTPLFNNLLAANLEQRLSNADDFKKIIEQCGYKTSHSGSLHEDSITPPAQNTHTDNSTANNHKSNSIVYLAIASVLVITIVVYFFAGNTAEKNYDIKKAKPVSPVESSPAIEQVETTPLKRPENRDIANSLYLESQQQVALNNYGSALMRVNNALKEQPGHPAAKILKQEIELEFEVRAYLSRAEKLITEGKLTRPANDNAYATYTKLAPLLPPDDQRAREGLQKVADRYFQIANNLILKKQLDSAEKYITTGLAVFADEPRLKQLEQMIAKAKTENINQ
ncbi:MAG: protein kinase [Gammaproteobacteria bacterium]|nr:protein kinase [Gammaproteobacteria bacterium]